MKQTEFDKLMNQLNCEEKLEKKDLENRLERLSHERAGVKLEISELNTRLAHLYIEILDLTARIKDIRTAYHNRRHELVCRWHEEGEYAHPTARADGNSVTGDEPLR